MIFSKIFSKDTLHVKPFLEKHLETNNIATWHEINSLLLGGLIDYPRIRLVNSQNMLSKAYSGFMRYSLTESGERIPKILPGVIKREIKNGSTLIIDRCEDYFPGVKDLIFLIESQIKCQAWANLYVSSQGSGGFGCHFDDHDIIAIQVYGRKEWVIYEPTYFSPTRGDKSFNFPPPKSTPLTTYNLSPSDALYLPHGFWHDVTTTSDISLHITIGMDFPRRIDIFNSLSNELIKSRFFRETIDLTDLSKESELIKKEIISSLQSINVQELLFSASNYKKNNQTSINLPSLS